jgi:hypothetical protein
MLLLMATLGFGRAFSRVLGGWPGMIQASTVPGSLEAKMLKPPRIIRLDPSDTFVFERARDPGEWAVSRAFMFWHCNDQAAPGQKQRVALRSASLVKVNVLAG